MVSQAIYSLLEILECEVSPNFHSILNKVPEYSSQYIEIRLSEQRQTDFLYSVNAKNPSDRLKEHATPSVEKILALYPGIPNIWLEYDNISLLKQGVCPNMHLCVAPDRNSDSAPKSTLSGLQIANILASLADGKLDNKADIKATVTIIQAHAELIHISVMGQRTPASIKLFVKVKESRLETLLEALNWQGSRSLLNEIRHYPWLKRREDGCFSLDLKINPMLSSYIAIVQSRINFRQDQFDPIRIAKLIESDVLSEEKHILAVMHWLMQPDSKEQFKWVDVKTGIENNKVFSKVYFGIQKRWQWVQ